MAYRRTTKRELESTFGEVHRIQKELPHLLVSEILNLKFSASKKAPQLYEPNPVEYGYSEEEFRRDIILRPLVRSRLVRLSLLFPIVLGPLAVFLTYLRSNSSFISSLDWIGVGLAGLALGGMVARIFYLIAWSRKEKNEFANYNRYVLELVSYWSSSRRRR